MLFWGPEPAALCWVGGLGWLHTFWGLCVLMSEMRGLGWTREGPGASSRVLGHGSVFGAGVGVAGLFLSQQSNSALIYFIWKGFQEKFPLK